MYFVFNLSFVQPPCSVFSVCLIFFHIRGKNSLQWLHYLPSREVYIVFSIVKCSVYTCNGKESGIVMCLRQLGIEFLIINGDHTLKCFHLVHTYFPCYISESYAYKCLFLLLHVQGHFVWASLWKVNVERRNNVTFNFQTHIIAHNRNITYALLIRLLLHTLF